MLCQKSYYLSYLASDIDLLFSRLGGVVAFLGGAILSLGQVGQNAHQLLEYDKLLSHVFGRVH